MPQRYGISYYLDMLFPVIPEWPHSDLHEMWYLAEQNYVSKSSQYSVEKITAPKYSMVIFSCYEGVNVVAVQNGLLLPKNVSENNFVICK